MSQMSGIQSAVAESVTTAHQAAANPAFLPDHWPSQQELLQNIQEMTPGVAAILVLAGVVYLIFGYQIFKALVLVNAAIVGAYFGAILGSKTGNNGLVGAIVGALLAAAATWPLMKYAVAVMGGVFGAMIGATAWHMAKLDGQFAWAGAGMGLIFFGLISFMLFRQCVMAYTSMQGSVMLIFGILGLVYKYPTAAQKLTQVLTDQRLLLPIAIFIPTLLGVLYQQHNSDAEPTGGGGKK